MSSDAYDKQLADVITPLGQSKATKLKNGFHSIRDVSLDAVSENYQFSPRQIRTGMTRGDQQIKGSYRVTDNQGTLRVIIGYDPGGF